MSHALKTYFRYFSKCAASFYKFEDLLQKIIDGIPRGFVLSFNMSNLQVTSSKSKICGVFGQNFKITQTFIFSILQPIARKIFSTFFCKIQTFISTEIFSFYGDFFTLFLGVNLYNHKQQTQNSEKIEYINRFMTPSGF
jgi:hypothetical protein